MVRPVAPEAEAEQGVAPVIVMPTVPKTDRRRYVTKRGLVKYGYADECQACTPLASDMHKAKVPHDDRCRDRIGELMAGDDDQRQVERVTSRAAVEVDNEIPSPEARMARLAGPETQSVPRLVEEQPIPTVRVGGSSGSGTRSEVGSRASETKMIVKRNVSDSQKAEVRKDKVKMLKNWQQRRKNNILMQMLRCLHTRHGELKTLLRMQQMQRPNK